MTIWQCGRIGALEIAISQPDPMGQLAPILDGPPGLPQPAWQLMARSPQ